MPASMHCPACFGNLKLHESTCGCYACKEGHPVALHQGHPVDYVKNLEPPVTDKRSPLLAGTAVTCPSGTPHPDERW